MNIPMEVAVERILHDVAGQIHTGMAKAGITTAALKTKLIEFGSENVELVDAILAATPAAGEASMRLLGEMAHVLGYQADFRAEPILSKDEKDVA